MNKPPQRGQNGLSVQAFGLLITFLGKGDCFAGLYQLDYAFVTYRAQTLALCQPRNCAVQKVDFGFASRLKVLKHRRVMPFSAWKNDRRQNLVHVMLPVLGGPVVVGACKRRQRLIRQTDNEIPGMGVFQKFAIALLGQRAGRVHAAVEQQFEGDGFAN